MVKLSAANTTAYRAAEQGSAPATPTSGFAVIYPKGDGRWYAKDDAGTERLLGSMDNPMTAAGDIIVGGASGTPARLAAGTNGHVLTLAAGTPAWQAPAAAGSVATDAIWDAAGDLAVGSGANTAAKLTKGSNGDVLTVTAGAVGWAAPAGGGGGGLYSAYICIQDQKAQNTAGGTFTSGAWRTHDLNTEMADTGNHASLASNQITLAAGTYHVFAWSLAYSVGSWQARLQNLTAGATLVTGMTGRIGGSGDTNSLSLISGRFTLAVQSVIELQAQSGATRSTDGFGTQANLTTEVYASVELWKES